MHTYLPRTRTLLATWLPDAREREKQIDNEWEALGSDLRYRRQELTELKDKSAAYHKDNIKKQEQCVFTSRRQLADWVSNAILPYIEEARELARKPAGLVPAIGLCFFIGKHSYTTSPGFGLKVMAILPLAARSNLMRSSNVPSSTVLLMPCLMICFLNCLSQFQPRLPLFTSTTLLSKPTTIPTMAAQPSAQMEFLLEHAKKNKRSQPPERAGETITEMDMWLLVFEKIEGAKSTLPNAPHEVHIAKAELEAFKTCWGAENIQAFLGASKPAAQVPAANVKAEPVSTKPAVPKQPANSVLNAPTSKADTPAVHPSRAHLLRQDAHPPDQSVIESASPNQVTALGSQRLNILGGWAFQVPVYVNITLRLQDAFIFRNDKAYLRLCGPQRQYISTVMKNLKAPCLDAKLQRCMENGQQVAALWVEFVPTDVCKNVSQVKTILDGLQRGFWAYHQLDDQPSTEYLLSFYEANRYLFQPLHPTSKLSDQGPSNSNLSRQHGDPRSSEIDQSAPRVPVIGPNSMQLGRRRSRSPAREAPMNYRDRDPTSIEQSNPTTRLTPIQVKQLSEQLKKNEQHNASSSMRDNREINTGGEGLTRREEIITRGGTHGERGEAASVWWRMK
ncbi:uncharacterized protein PAC_10178 [Phialocephala subalpina]|uniref:Uncharacterized protein n=1 Tax=Phialocephala subalpina TaxID=576137 RepID=A0A1L7X5H8_9HELO|nr:uncharacterized protein PAC_10178 [Phialocephala subalpina]